MTLKEAIDTLRAFCWEQDTCAKCGLVEWCDRVRQSPVTFIPSTWPRLEE